MCQDPNGGLDLVPQQINRNREMDRNRLRNSRKFERIDTIPFYNHGMELQERERQEQ